MSNGPVTQAEIEAIREEWAKDLEILDATPGLTGIEDSATAVATLLRGIDERDYTMCDLNAIADSKESIEDGLRLEIEDLKHQLASRNNDVLSLEVQREQLRQEVQAVTAERDILRLDAIERDEKLMSAFDIATKESSHD